MTGFRKIPMNVARIARVGIGLKTTSLPHQGLNLPKEGMEGFSPVIRAKAVVPPSPIGQRSLGRHDSDLKSQNLSFPRKNRQGDGKRLALGMLHRFQLIELNFPEVSPPFHVGLLLKSGFSGEKPELSGHGDAVNSQNHCGPAHGDAGAQKLPKLGVHGSFLLPEAGGTGGGRKRSSAG
jgi:hypothetical protein